MASHKSALRSVAILIAIAAAVFAASTVAISSASSSSSLASRPPIPHPFSRFGFQGSLRAPSPSTFAISFSTSFTLSPKSQGITAAAGRALDSVLIQQAVAYPVPASHEFVGPAKLPFGSQRLMVRIGLHGACFHRTSAGAYVFAGDPGRCTSAAIVLGKQSYNAGSLLERVSATLTPAPFRADTLTHVQAWNGMFTATFRNPGYTFPVAAFGDGSVMVLKIGDSGGVSSTKSLSYGGPTPVADFSISTSPPLDSSLPGGSVNTTVNTGIVFAPAQTVTLSAGGLPPGTSASFNPPSVTAGSPSDLTITTSPSTPDGSYAISVTGTGTTATHTATYTLTVGRIQSQINPFRCALQNATSFSCVGGVRSGGAVLGKTPVMLTYTTPSGTPTARTVYTNSDGTFTDQYQPATAGPLPSGNWQIKASYAGDSTHSPAMGSQTVAVP